MPAKSSTPEPDNTPATDTVPALLAPGEAILSTQQVAPLDEPNEAGAPDLLPAGTYLFTGTLPTQYLHVPLTAYPASDDRPATVFGWAFGAPADGRWEPTKKKPNSLPDNAPARPEGE